MIFNIKFKILIENFSYLFHYLDLTIEIHEPVDFTHIPFTFSGVSNIPEYSTILVYEGTFMVYQLCTRNHDT